MSNIDQYRQYDEPETATLTWEVIERRGIKSGDCMELWKMACIMSLSIDPMMENIERLCGFMVMKGQPDIAAMLANHYVVFRGYIARDVAEIIKFLVQRDFHFPELSPDELSGD